MTRIDGQKKEPPMQIRDQIDLNLKRIYQDIVNEEVPERFLVLLDRLREKTEAGGSGNGSQT